MYPESTPERLSHHSTTHDYCECGDFKYNQGGSYYYEGENCCKHRYHVLWVDDLIHLYQGIVEHNLQLNEICEFMTRNMETQNDQIAKAQKTINQQDKLINELKHQLSIKQREVA